MSPTDSGIASSSSYDSSAVQNLAGASNNSGDGDPRDTADLFAGDINGSGDGDPRITVDLVAGGRRRLSFLRSLAGCPLLHHSPTILRSIRRYEELWMPLIADLSKTSPAMIVPPADVEWIWHCHCLDPARYGEYCASRFGDLVDRPAILDDENEEYAAGQGREIWAARYPSEPFDLEIDGEACGDDGGTDGADGGDLLGAVVKHGALPSYFADPFFSETVYLVFAKRRYLRFLQLLKRFANGGVQIVPTSDILLMFLTHQSFPRSYARDTKGLGDLMKSVLGFGDQATSMEVEAINRAWEEEFDEPYQRAGSSLDPETSPSRVYFNWDPSYDDVNRKYKGLHPRFLMEVFIFLKGNWEEKEAKDANKTFLRLRTIRCHREMKMDMTVSNSSCETWRKVWHIYCEFGTRGIVLEVRQRGSSCLRNSKLLKKVVFLWNDLLRSTTLSLTRDLQMQVKAMSSVTPPVQAPYLLKCVPDKVTDDNGAMVSDVILRMNQYHPQHGRWLSRTILDHARRECFVVRIRVGRGMWRRGAEFPTAVKWEDRIIEVREGPWSYVANSIGSAPEKIVGTAAPMKTESLEKKAVWCLSTGDVLTIQWEDGLNFQLENENATESVRLLIGRKLQYQVKEVSSANVKHDDEQYITLVRFSSEYPDGRATALLNWKLLAFEFLPEEDAVLVLLLSMAIVRTISEVRKEDVSGLLMRRRLREAKAGNHDWGSLLLPSPSYSSPHLKPWYWNAKEVLALTETIDAREPIYKYSLTDGKDELYKQVIIP